jgi:hypothetical protein
MSAWYVFSAMGMYPVCPGSPVYALGEPAFQKLVINLDGGRKISIVSNRSADKPVLKGVTFFGGPGPRSFAIHNFIKRGIKLDFIYTTEKDTANFYGKAVGMCPKSSADTRKKVLPAPLISSSSQVFRDTMTVSLMAPGQAANTMFYQVLRKGKPMKALPYVKPLKLDSTTSLVGYYISGKDTSCIAEASFYKLKYNYEVTLITRPDPQYSAAGGLSIIDAKKGDHEWRKGHSQGYQGGDMEVVVDLHKSRPVSYLSVNCLQDTRSWIIFPVQVSFYGSADKKEFTLLGTADNTRKAEDQNVQTQKYNLQLPSETKVRYIKIVAKNFGKLPQWHQGAGGDAYIFCDEVEVGK